MRTICIMLTYSEISAGALVWHHWDYSSSIIRPWTDIKLYILCIHDKLMHPFLWAIVPFTLTIKVPPLGSIVQYGVMVVFWCKSQKAWHCTCSVMIAQFNRNQIPILQSLLWRQERNLDFTLMSYVRALCVCSASTVQLCYPMLVYSLSNTNMYSNNYVYWSLSVNSCGNLI